MPKRTVYFPCPRIFSPDQIPQRYPAAPRILSEIGLRRRHSELLEPVQKAGLRVDGDRVYMGQAAVADLVEDGSAAIP